MKIGFVLDDTLDSTDGVQQYVLSLGKQFTREGHDVHYLVGETRRSDIKNVHSLSRNVRVGFNKNRMSTPLPVAMSRIDRLLAQEAFDILHIQMPYSPFLGGKVVRKAAHRNIPVVGTFHILPASLLETVSVKLLGQLQQRSVHSLSHIMAVSEPAKTLLDQAYAVRSSVLPNPVDVKQYRPVRPRSKKNHTQRSIIFLGRLVPRKGCQEFLYALSALRARDKLKNVRVTICGDGPERRSLEAYAKHHKLNEYVEFVGFVSEPQKQQYLQHADIAVFPSLGGESFGIVLIEAMAAAVQTVLAGDNPGYRSVMDNREQQLVLPKDTHMFAHRLQHYISNDQARKDTFAWQQIHVKKFDVTLVASQLMQKYTEAIAKNDKKKHTKKKRGEHEYF